MYKIIICVSRPKSAYFSSESGFSGRGAAEAEQGKTKGTFWQRRILHFLSDCTNYKAKDIICKICNTIKKKNIIYCDRTIIGFVGFVPKLPNRPTDGATVSDRKNASEKVRPKKNYFLTTFLNHSLMV
jgi:hypothetical protein